MSETENGSTVDNLTVDYDVFPKQVRHAMADAGINSLAELARKAGVDPNTIQNWYKGTSLKGLPKGETLFRVAQALDTTVERLVTGNDPKPDSEIDEATYEVAQAIADRPTLRVVMDQLTDLTDSQIAAIGNAIPGMLAMLGSMQSAKGGMEATG